MSTIAQDQNRTDTPTSARPRLTSLGLAVVMLGAIAMVHLPAGFFLPNGAEFALTLLGAVATLALAGPGPFSLDAVVARREGRS